MNRIQGPTVAPGNLFSDGDPLVAQPATVVEDVWLNDVQEELVNLVLDMGSSLDPGDRRQVVAAVLKAAAQGAVGNVIHNGDFRVWSRFGETPPANNVTNVLGFRGPDRWLLKAGQAGETASCSLVELTNSVEISPSGVATVLHLNKSVAAGPGDTTLLVHRAEKVQTFQGRPVYVAFDTRKFSGADHNLIGVDLVQHFGTGGSPSADVVTSLSAQAGLVIDSSWRRLRFAGTLPTTVGKITGSNNDHWVELRLRFAQGVAFDVLLTAFTFSRGAADPGFFPRPLAQEEELCRRHYENSWAQNKSRATSGGDEEVALWDFGLNLGAAVGTLLRHFRTAKYRFSGAFGLTWFALDGTADSITEDTATNRAVTTAGLDRSVTGMPLVTSPPAGGTMRQLRAQWEIRAEMGAET